MNFSHLTSYLDTIPKTGIPSVDVAVSVGHTCVYRHSAGFLDPEKIRTPDDRTIYRLFSATKPITCTATVKLLAEGRIALDDPLSDYLPEFRNMVVMENGKPHLAKNPILLRHLFTMSAGFGYDLNTPAFLKAQADHPHPDTRTMIRALADTPLYFEPGTNFRYGLSHDVLAAVVEVVSGVRFGSYLKDNFFDPLGMTDFGFTLPPQETDRLATQYLYQNKLNYSTVRENNNGFVFPDSDYESGGAGLYGTLPGYLAFCEMLSSDGVGRDGTRILPPRTAASMGQNLLPDCGLAGFRDSQRKQGYGFGLCCRAHMSPVISLSESPVGEFGWDSATGWYVLMDPINRVSIVLAAHVRGSDYIYQAVHPRTRNLVYEALRENRLIPQI